MAYIQPTFDELLAQALDDIKSVTGASTINSTSILRAIAVAASKQATAHHDHIEYRGRQGVPFTATDEALEAWGLAAGVQRKDAMSAKGAVQLSGVPGSVVPQGALLTRMDKQQFSTDIEIAIGSTGFAQVAVTALTAGSQGNTALASTLVVSNSYAGINSNATVSVALVGGSDMETDPSLRTRTMSSFRSPSQGGAENDYVNWAKSVPGITRAWLTSQTTGPGQVVVYVMLDDVRSSQNGFPQGSSGGASLESRIAKATGDQLLVANGIFDLQPVTVKVYVAAPVALPINVTLSNLSPDTPTIRSNIRDSLAKLYKDIGTPLGQTITTSQISEAISRASGVGVFTLASPSASVVVPLGRLPTVGTLS